MENSKNFLWNEKGHYLTTLSSNALLMIDWIHSISSWILYEVFLFFWMLSPMKSHSLFHISNGPSPNAFLFLFYSFILLHGMYNEFAFLYSFTYHSMVFISRIGVPGLLLNKSYVFFGPYLLFLDFVRFVFSNLFDSHNIQHFYRFVNIFSENSSKSLLHFWQRSLVRHQSKIRMEL